MQYRWDKIVTPGESVEQEFTISGRYIQIIIAAIVICGIAVSFNSIYVGIIIFLLGGLYIFYLKKSKHYAFTNKRIILVESFLGTTTINIDYSQITDIETEQSFVDQLGGWGTLIINTAGTHVPEVRLTFIDNPEGIKQKLDQIRYEKK